MSDQEADVCLFLEGTYPYVLGGVSTWTHKLILAYPDLTFHIVCLIAPNSKLKVCFDIPENVISMTTVELQKLPKKHNSLSKKKQKEFFDEFERTLLNLQLRPKLSDLKKIVERLKEIKESVGQEFLLNSEASWHMSLRVYNELMGSHSFLNFFWVYRGVLAGLFSVLLGPLPKARIYHTLCTGYAGLYLARAKVETGRPCCLTEHGIYTNERRIELIASDYLAEENFQDLVVGHKIYEKDLKDFLIDFFSAYAKLTYYAASKIVTLYDGNLAFQMEDGADFSKIDVIPNGVQFEKYAKLPRDIDHPPTVALIGRIVPIKDIKTFIRSVAYLKKHLPNVIAYVLGPTEEDPHYYEECLDVVEYEKLQDTVIFTGQVKIEEYLPKIDMVALTSISEAQPLVLLEAGAAGIPFVSTDVGCCIEIAEGKESENPKIGQAGLIAKHLDPKAFADCFYAALSNKTFYNELSKNIQERVRLYYSLEAQRSGYRYLYNELLGEYKITVGS